MDELGGMIFTVFPHMTSYEMKRETEKEGFLFSTCHSMTWGMNVRLSILKRHRNRETLIQPRKDFGEDSSNAFQLYPRNSSDRVNCWLDKQNDISV